MSEIRNDSRRLIVDTYPTHKRIQVQEGSKSKKDFNGAGDDDGGSNIHYVVGIEDKSFFHWQLAILLESFYGREGSFPSSWKTIIVVCNDGDKPISSILEKICAVYSKNILLLYGENRPQKYPIDMSTGEIFLGVNKIEAMRVAGRVLGENDLAFISDTDIFLFGQCKKEIFPKRNALFNNWIVRYAPFLSLAGERGIDLQIFLQSLGDLRPFRSGGVAIFLDKETLMNTKFVQDCFRLTQALYLLAKVINNPIPNMTEMAAYALSLHMNSIEYDILSSEEFTTENDSWISIPEGSFYHYYCCPTSSRTHGAFYKSSWFKQKYYQNDFLEETSFSELQSLQEKSSSAHESYFFVLSLWAKERIYSNNTTRMSTSQLSSGTSNGGIIISNTTALSGGTRTNDDNAISLVLNRIVSSGAAETIITPEPAPYLIDPSETTHSPIELSLNEGLVLMADAITATGTWRLMVNVEWDEVDPARYF